MQNFLEVTLGVAVMLIMLLAPLVKVDKKRMSH
jgi:hypothetical protein